MQKYFAMALPKNVYKLSCPYWKRNVASIAESQDINSRTFDTFQSAKLNFEFDIQKSPLNSENYCAVLKGKPIKSPSSKILEFQTEDVAHLLALEWNASVLNQKDFTHSRPIVHIPFVDY